MTRKKVHLSFIANDSARKSTYKKRKKGLLKKVDELATLCGVDACAIIYSPYEAEPVVWPHKEGARKVVEEFRRLPQMDQNRRMYDHPGYLRQRIAKSSIQLSRLERENREKEVSLVMYDCIAGRCSVESMSFVDFKDLSWMIQRSLKELELRIDALKLNDNNKETVDNQTDGDDGGSPPPYSPAPPLKAASEEDEVVPPPQVSDPPPVSNLLQAVVGEEVMAPPPTAPATGTALGLPGDGQLVPVGFGNMDAAGGDIVGMQAPFGAWPPSHLMHDLGPYSQMLMAADTFGTGDWYVDAAGSSSNVADDARCNNNCSACGAEDHSTLMSIVDQLICSADPNWGSSGNGGYLP